ncbi:MAG: hypothetical protein ACFE9T_11700 [Promethearchaeota archaeon]
MLSIVIVIFQIIFIVGFVAFWIYFFLVENKNPERTEVYLVFEKSFILADLVFATPALILSVFGILTDQKFGYFFSVIAGSALIFLFLMDLCFNLQQGTYKKRDSSTLLEMGINIMCVIFGPLFIIYGWFNL